MNSWLQNSVKNLLPLSVEKSDFKKALKEWSFSGDIIDHETCSETCELCEKDTLRYHFQITNTLENALWVGSKCIEKFDIRVVDEEGKEVTADKNIYLLKQARIKHVRNVLHRLSDAKPAGMIGRYYKKQLDSYCIDKYSTEGKLDAKMLNYLFLRLDEENIFYDKRFFSISLRSDENKRKLSALSDAQFARISKSLNAQQRKYYFDHAGKKS